MRALDHPGFRFLARCALLSAATISLWYFVLLAPLLALMRVSTGALLNLVPGSFSEATLAVDAKGDWTATLSIPTGEAAPWLSQYIPADRPAPRALTIQLAVQKITLGYFTLGLPLFWAVVLAAPRSRRFWRALGFGTLILAGAALLLCLITIGHLAAPYLWGPGSWIGFVFDVGSYLGAYAVPYVAPFLVVVLLLPELRSILVPWEEEPEIEAATSSAAASRENQSATRKR